ncbi:MAG: undecaprenyl/decaprenyl-phosphate alpha-N-acetylglucosaminyl 1-phosphate transferase [Saprospiraceae bacterium]|nr:undecaprenyl/decaprenyl-phosphate alpha-N-acetylglucosaminyl 1-phosphate transferase [Saprospiraceae bacterium]
MNFSNIIILLTAFLLTLLFIPVLRKAAVYFGLVDKPGQRKIHIKPIPLVGGLGIYFAVTLTLAFIWPVHAIILNFKNPFIATTILLIMGVIDDRFDLNALLKLSVQLLLAHYTFMQGIKIESLHGLFGIFDLSGDFQYILTIIIIAGVINAFNLMDGIDGLAGGIGITGFGIFSYLAVLTNQTQLLLIFIALTGALLAFLYFNLSQKQKIFMGDAGSMMIGYILVVSGINLLQNAGTSGDLSIAAAIVVSVLMIPVYDAIRVFKGRMKKGKSPFFADKSHLHHLLLSLGFSHRSITINILILMFSLIVIGYFFLMKNGITWSFFVTIIILIIATNLLQYFQKLNLWKSRIKKMEIHSGQF